MKTNLFSVIAISALIFAAQAQSQSKTQGQPATKQLDKYDEQALQQTTELLTDKTIREKAISKDPKAQQADAYAKKVAGEKTEDVYALAAKVFDRLVRKYGGDVDKLKEVIAKAQKDPAGFATTEFSPEEIKMLKEISAQIPQTNGAPK